MSEVTEVIEGRISNITYKSTSKSNWKTYEASLNDGSTKKLLVPPDGAEPKSGDYIRAKKGNFGGWILEKQEGAAPPPKRSEEKTQGSVVAGTKDNYWSDKSDYEKNVRDKKIEKQFYVSFVGQMFNANPDLNGEELNERIDQVVEKAEELFKNANK